MLFCIRSRYLFIFLIREKGMICFGIGGVKMFLLFVIIRVGIVRFFMLLGLKMGLVIGLMVSIVLIWDFLRLDVGGVLLIF